MEFCIILYKHIKHIHTNQEINRLIRRSDKHYKSQSRSNRPIDCNKFLVYKHLVRHVSESAYERYMRDILGLNPETNDIDSPTKVNTKKIYSLLTYISKQDNSGISKVSNGAKIRNRYNQVPHLTQDTNGKVTNSQKTPQTRAKRSALSQQVTTKHI